MMLIYTLLLSLQLYANEDLLLKQNHYFSSDHLLRFRTGTEFSSKDRSRIKLSYWDIDYRKNQFISEKTYLIWSPLPFGIGKVLGDSDTNQSSAEWFIKSMIGPYSAIVPTFMGRSINLISPRTTYWSQLSYGFTLPLFERRWEWEGELDTGPRFLIFKDFIFATYFNASISNVLFAGLFNDDEQVELPDATKKIGLKGRLEYSLSKNFFTSVEYSIHYVSPLWDFMEALEFSVTALF